MATWQFDLFLVPCGGPMPSRNDDGYDVPTLPESQTQVANTLLTQKLGDSCLLLEKWWIFGEEQGNRIDLGLSETGGAELFARIDARIDSEPFCQTICEVAAQLGCVLFSAESGEIIEPEVSALMSALKNSRAFAFACDPRGFLGRGQHGG